MTMNISLYDVIVRNFIQTLGAVQGFVERGAKHCAEAGIDLNDVLETRLAPDMLPFRYQIISVIQHSVGAIEGVEKGVFAPPADASYDYAGLQQALAEAGEKARAYTPEEINALYGRDLIFLLSDMKLPFLAQDFLLSFSVPNFYFHAVTAYDILRSRGVPIGKRDFLGRLRLNR